MSCSCCTSSVSQAQQGSLRFQTDIALAKKSLDATKSQGEAIVQLLEAAAAIGNSEGKGTGLDAVA
jgi:hypothetical protein